MIIRRANVNDLEAITEVEKISYPAEEAASYAKFEYRLEHFPKWMFVAEIDGEVVANVTGRPMAQRLITDDYYDNEEREEGDALAILSVVTHPDFRKKGIAAEVLKYALKEARKEGLKTSSLCCKTHLIDYYSKFGYVLLGESKSEHGGAKWFDMEVIL